MALYSGAARSGSASVVRRAADRVTSIPARPPVASARLRATREAEVTRSLAHAIRTHDTHAISCDDDSTTGNPLVDPFDTQRMWDE